MQKTIMTLVLIGMLTSLLPGQEAATPPVATDLPTQLAQTPPEHRPGIFKADDKVYISDESKRLLTDAEYRTGIFPESYTFEAIPDLLEQKKIQLTLWYLVNLFEDNKVLTIQIVRDLGKMGIKAEHLVNAFHTYVFADPEIMSFADGTVALMDPQRMEHKAAIANFLGQFCNQNQNNHD